MIGAFSTETASETRRWNTEPGIVLAHLLVVQPAVDDAHRFFTIRLLDFQQRRDFGSVGRGNRERNLLCLNKAKAGGKHFGETGRVEAATVRVRELRG